MLVRWTNKQLWVFILESRTTDSTETERSTVYRLKKLHQLSFTINKTLNMTCLRHLRLHVNVTNGIRKKMVSCLTQQNTISKTLRQIENRCIKICCGDILWKNSQIHQPTSRLSPLFLLAGSYSTPPRHFSSLLLDN